ncbi:unnamed protein product [Paramecium primaurelia]|uniref:Amino acid transporter transmembrane domain-containing protein n=1 Tax=Paramecium primaurelia TaxID=5886 RepID=A0A8S1LQW3_PARPR|nr:unnamed protein product [Paramecium primaurelia]
MHQYRFIYHLLIYQYQLLYKKWNLVEPDAEKIMMAFDIMIFAYKIIGVLTEIIVEMNDTISFQKFAMILETILYLFFGITSSLLFYSNTDQSIITNFQKEYKGNYPIEVTLSILKISYVYQHFNSQYASLSFGKNKSRQNQEIHFKNHLCTLLNGIINLIIIQLTAFCILNLLQFYLQLDVFVLYHLDTIIPYGMTFHYELKPIYQIINIIVVLFRILGGIFGIITCFD